MAAPLNAVTKAKYKGCNAFQLSLAGMLKGFNDPRWATMVQIIDAGGKYHPGEKWHLKKGSEATYVEYWYPYDLRVASLAPRNTPTKNSWPKSINGVRPH